MFQYLLLLFGLLKSPGQKETALLALFAYVFHRGGKSHVMTITRKNGGG